MRKEMITMHQAACIIVMFIFGSSVVMGVSSTADQDSWMSLLLAAVFAMPVILLFARIMRLFPEKDLFDIMETLFGKIAGKIIIALMTWYAVHLARWFCGIFRNSYRYMPCPRRRSFRS